jgi:hypothetical protein
MNIRPWEIDLLTADEFYALCDEIELIEKSGGQS